MGLIDELRAISKQINEQGRFMTTKEATKQVSILPFIRALGYNIFNVKEVVPKYNVAGWEVDYAIVVDEEAQMLIEIKTATQPLSMNLPVQLLRHIGPPKHRIGLITNGIQYHFYAPVDNHKYVDTELFLQVDLQHFDEEIISNLKYVAKQTFNPQKIVFNATKIKYKSDIRSILEANYRQPSEEFVRFFAIELHSGIVPVGFVEELAPIVAQVFRDFVEKKHKAHQPQLPIVTRGATPAIPVFADYKGHRFEATLLLTDEIKVRQRNIRFKGKLLTPSKAGGMAIHFVSPDVAQPNGWTFWSFHDPSTKKERPISDLRDNEALRRRLLSHYRQG